MAKKGQNGNRNAVVDFIVRNGDVFDASALLENFENIDATEHIRSGECALRNRDADDVKLSEWSDEDNAEVVGWFIHAENFSCECGELVNVTLQVPGLLEFVAARALGIDRRDILD